MSHNHEPQVKSKKVLLIAFILTTAFAILEIVTGWLIHSLALLGEGIHMFSDGLNLLMGLIAVTIGMKAATAHRPFGFRRIETITAFVNGLILMIIPIFIFVEAIQRFNAPREILGLNMLIVAGIGLIINLIVAIMLFKADSSSLNIRAAATHVLADLLSSVSTIAVAILIMAFNWTILDPIVSAVVSIIIFMGGLKITKEAFNVLMEGLPHDIDVEELRKEILSVKGISNVDDLKVWSITTDENYGIVHLKTDSTLKNEKVLNGVKQITKKFNIHCTIQIESN